MIEQLLTIAGNAIGPDPGGWSWSGAKGVFNGVVPSTELISGSDLITLVGITQGTTINSDAGWLHFTFRGKEIYIAKMSFKHSITYAHLNTLNLVNGSKVVNIKGVDYILRLPKGQRNQAFAGSRVTSGGDTTYYSEWNKLMYLASNGAFADAAANLSREGISTGSLGGFTEAQLGTGGSLVGRYCYCMENNGASSTYRGGPNITTIWYNTFGTSGTDVGWRPVLERL